jgi:hypothetical protein
MQLLEEGAVSAWAAFGLGLTVWPLMVFIWGTAENLYKRHVQKKRKAGL